MSSYDSHGYINKPHHSGRKFSGENKHGYVNDQDLKSSTDYDLPDYEGTDTTGRDNNKHIYRGLDPKHVNELAYQGTAKPQVRDGYRENSYHRQRAKKGNRKLIVAIVVLVVLLVAMAATFAVLYFMRSKDSSESTSPEAIAKTTKATSTPRNTKGATTSATTSTTESVTVTNSETTQETTTSEATTSTTTTAVSSTTESLTIEEMCQIQGGLIPHPQECQSYYDCQYPKPELSECEYPQLFSTETMACEHFENVTCGERKEAKQGCDYRYINCYGMGCIPCFVNYPSCAGMEDGFNTFENRLWSPYYVVCYKERFVAELECSGSQRFSPEYGGCVDADRIPPEHGGTKPDCTGKEDGFYPNEYGSCNLYTECAFGQYKKVHTCPGSQAFDETTKSCSDSPTSLCICSKSGC